MNPEFRITVYQKHENPEKIEGHIPQLVQLDDLYKSETYSSVNVLDETSLFLRKGYYDVIVMAHKGDKLVGFMTVKSADEEKYELATAYVMPGHRKNGLFDCMEEISEEIAKARGARKIIAYPLKEMHRPFARRGFIFNGQGRKMEKAV